MLEVELILQRGRASTERPPLRHLIAIAFACVDGICPEGLTFCCALMMLGWCARGKFGTGLQPVSEVLGPSIHVVHFVVILICLFRLCQSKHRRFKDSTVSKHCQLQSIAVSLLGTRHFYQVIHVATHFLHILQAPMRAIAPPARVGLALRLALRGWGCRRHAAPALIRLSCSNASKEGTAVEGTKLRLVATSPLATQVVAHYFAASLLPGDCYLLYGDVGAGKSYFR